MTVITRPQNTEFEDGIHLGWNASPITGHHTHIHTLTHM